MKEKVGEFSIFFKNMTQDSSIWRQIKPFRWRLLIGSILVLTAIVIITRNEIEAIKTTKSLSSVYNNLKTIRDVNKINADNEGSLVYITGELHVEEPLTEPDYGVSVPSVCLKRRVQMYQWIEFEDKTKYNTQISDLPDGKVYLYEKDWRDKLIDGSKFKLKIGHENPEKFPLTTKLYVSEVVRIGAYIFSPKIKEKFTDFITITSDERPETRDIKLHSGLYYHSNDVWNPEVGDIRVQFSFAGMSGDVVSIIALQKGKFLGNEGPILLTQGKVLPDEMIKDEHNQNIWIVRLFRSLGWICLYIAAPFFAVFIDILSSRFTKFFNFLILDGFLTPNITFASILFTIIISHKWYFYDATIGLCIIFGFQLPWFIFAIYKKFKLIVQKKPKLTQ